MAIGAHSGTGLHCFLPWKIFKFFKCEWRVKEKASWVQCQASSCYHLLEEQPAGCPARLLLVGNVNWTHHEGASFGFRANCLLHGKHLLERVLLIPRTEVIFLARESQYAEGNNGFFHSLCHKNKSPGCHLL